MMINAPFDMVYVAHSMVIERAVGTLYTSMYIFEYYQTYGSIEILHFSWHFVWF